MSPTIRWLAASLLAASACGDDGLRGPAEQNGADVNTACVSDCGPGVVTSGPEILVSPQALDWGLTDIGVSASRLVTVTNRGDETLVVGGLSLEPETVGFSLGVDAPLLVEPEQSQPLTVIFEAAAPGLAEAQLVLESNDRSSPAVVVTLRGQGREPDDPEPRVQVDTFEQSGDDRADLLFVVDDSNSMWDETPKLEASMQSMAGYLSTSGVDFRVGFTSTDMEGVGGELLGNVLTPFSAGFYSEFVSQGTVGSWGSNEERAFDAAAAALSASQLRRPGVRLFVVLIGDQNDDSAGSVADHASTLIGLGGGDPTRVFFVAVAGPVPMGCWDQAADQNATPGTRYDELVSLTGGWFFSICAAPHFGGVLSALPLIEPPGDSFTLTYSPIESTLLVRVDGVIQSATAWRYASGSRQIRFDPADVPTPGATITVHYEVMP